MSSAPAAAAASASGTAGSRLDAPRRTPSGHGPGTRGNLTPQQTRTLYRLWARFFRLCQTPASTASASASVHSATLPNGSGASPLRTTRSRGGGGMAEASGGADEEGSSDTAARSEPNGANLGRHIPRDDGVKDELKTLEEAKEMRVFLARYGGERLRSVFWEMTKGEHPDALMLRFLRARRWDVDRAIAVIGSTANFRVENEVAEVLRGGELNLTRTRGGLNLFANGVSYAYGASRDGEPVYLIEVGSHFSHNQTQAELKRAVILHQEWLSLLMPPPVEQKIVIFNLRNFGLRNMDWWTVFFMVKTMESYYVESLARVYVHCPPWIFKPIWIILRPLLDPVVRDKIRLTSTLEELEELIPAHHLPRDSMGGSADWGYSYPPPEEHENDAQLDTARRAELQAAHDAAAAEFERLTRQVARAYSSRRAAVPRRSSDADPTSAATTDSEFDEDDEDDDAHADIAADVKALRDVAATRLRVAWLRLMPYIIGRTVYNRWNVARDDGSVMWTYDAIDGTHEEQRLGEGTTLPVLEENLAQLDAALGNVEPRANGSTNGASASAPHARQRSHQRMRTAGSRSFVLDEALGMMGDGAKKKDGALSGQADELREAARPDGLDATAGLHPASEQPAAPLASPSSEVPSQDASSKSQDTGSTAHAAPLPVHPLFVER